MHAIAPSLPSSADPAPNINTHLYIRAEVSLFPIHVWPENILVWCTLEDHNILKSLWHSHRTSITVEAVRTVGWKKFYLLIYLFLINNIQQFGKFFWTYFTDNLQSHRNSSTKFAIMKPDSCRSTASLLRNRPSFLSYSASCHKMTSEYWKLYNTCLLSQKQSEKSKTFWPFKLLATNLSREKKFKQNAVWQMQAFQHNTGP